MPTNLTGDPSSFPTQTAPVAGEPRTAAGVATPFQNTADRTAWCKDRIEFIDPDKSGARRFRRFTSIADMEASVDFPDGTFAYVDSVGLYQFNVTSTLTASAPFIVAPTSLGGGPGRWILEAFGVLNVANGIPQLDGTGKLPGKALAIANADGRIKGENVVNGRPQLAMKYTAGATTLPVDVSFHEIIGPTTTLTLVAGQAALINYSFRIVMANIGEQARFQCEVTKPDTTTTIGDSMILVKPNTGLGWATLQLMMHIVADADGNYVFRLQGSGNSGNTSTIDVDRIYTRIEVVQP